MELKHLNIFYQEPDPDRWLPFDRYPRKIIRRVLRGKPRPGGQMMVFLNLLAGLDRIGVPYRVNDFNYIEKHPEELACIVGKPQVLFERKWRNPVLFGAAVFSHPIECLELFDKYPVKRMLVPGEWMRRMCEPYYGDQVIAWPVGIDTEKWQDTGRKKDLDVLLYDKVRWEHSAYEKSLIDPIRQELIRRNIVFEQIRYGAYRPQELWDKVQRAKSVIFLCEHETQGLAYQQILSANVPVLAWDRMGYWQDPSLFPHKVKFEPVSSVPYWDERCGKKFENLEQFRSTFDAFWYEMETNKFKPREYILENLTLEKCAQKYVEIARSIMV